MNPPIPPPGLEAPVTLLRSVGPKKAEALAELGITTIEDLLLYLPRAYLDRSMVESIAELQRRLRRDPGDAIPEVTDSDGPGIRTEVTVIGEVRSFRVIGVGKRSRLVLVLSDGTGSLQCVWFGGVNYWKRAFAIGETLAVSGQPTFYGGVLQIVHPQVDRLGTRDDGLAEGQEWKLVYQGGGLVPLYPSGQELARIGLESNGFRRLIRGALDGWSGRIAEILPPGLIRRDNFPGRREAITAAHFPPNREAIDSALARLKYEELFLFQLRLALRRRWREHALPGIGFNVASSLARRLVDSLPFSLTRAQVRVVREIAQDMESPHPMHRLLQGDVGSGKTVVALLAMLIAVDNGYQALFMAPTEILAEQHFGTLVRSLGDLPVTVRLLVGAQRSRLRQDVLDDVRRGSAHIVVGTHALLEKGVGFAKLGMVVIDEQHRFGVMQRAAVREKGRNPDVLVMTATPIPRTLSLTLYGDLEISLLDELPHGRKPIWTVVKSENERESVYAFVREAVRAGRQAYFVFPLIEESEKVDLQAALRHYEELKKRVFADLRVGLVHGRMPAEEKDAVMRAFTGRSVDILVATTVIEVGIDVSNATVMVIENAERFGLAQLHQLRGRVGRGGEQSTCILVAASWVASRARRSVGRGQRDGEEEERAARRLRTMLETTDGFRIAEMDLTLRGPGDFFGTRQSGLPAFRIADVVADRPLLERARVDAFEIIAGDPQLRSDEHRALADHLRRSAADDLHLLRTG